jgi:hypothetical protein
MRFAPKSDGGPPGAGTSTLPDDRRKLHFDADVAG